MAQAGSESRFITYCTDLERGTISSDVSLENLALHQDYSPPALYHVNTIRRNCNLITFHDHKRKTRK